MKKIRDLIIISICAIAFMLTTISCDVKGTVDGIEVHGIVYDTIEVLRYDTILVPMEFPTYIHDTIFRMEYVTRIDTVRVTVIEKRTEFVHDTVYVAAKQESPVNIIFAQNFEGGLALRPDTLSKYWNFKDAGFKTSSQAVVDVGGVNGKVWQSTYHSGLNANQDGAVGNAHFSRGYKELYMEYDIWFAPDWNGTSTAGMSSGKSCFGLGGWKDPLYPTGSWKVDSSAGGHGFEGQSVWGSGSPNSIRAYWYDQNADGQVNGMNSTSLTVNKGFWRRYGRRIVMNDLGKSNGIYEVYLDGVMIDQRKDIKWASVAQMKAGQGYITYLAVRYFWGGGGVNYNSSGDNIVRWDNLVVYYPTSHSETYPAGPSPAGHKIPRIGKDRAGLPNVNIPHVLYNETFRTASGSVKAQYNGDFHVPSAINYRDIYTKEIFGHTTPIHFKVMQYDNGFNEVSTGESYIKVYSGVGASKTLVYWFQEAGEQNGELTVGQTFDINATDCTIEFYPGNDANGGFHFDYN